MLMLVFQLALILAIKNEILENFFDYKIPTDMPFRLFISKFVVTIAVHLNIYPVLSQGFEIMRFVNNHPNLFDKDLFCFFLGLVILLFSLVFEFLNIIILFCTASRLEVAFYLVAAMLNRAKSVVRNDLKLLLFSIVYYKN